MNYEKKEKIVGDIVRHVMESSAGVRFGDTDITIHHQDGEIVSFEVRSSKKVKIYDKNFKVYDVDFLQQP